MSKFIDRLNQMSRAAPQPMGFGTKQTASSRLKLQLLASVTQESAESVAGYLAGADAGILRISEPDSTAQALLKISQAVPDIIWGGWLHVGSLEKADDVSKIGGDFLVFPAHDTPLAMFQDDDTGRILEIKASINEGLLRGVNELPVDAVLIAGEEKENNSLTWQDLMLFRRFTELLTKPLLVTVPSGVTASEFQAVWSAGVSGVVVDVTTAQLQDRMKELRQVIDKLEFPTAHRPKKTEAILPQASQESGQAVIEEEEEEEEE